MQGFFLPGAKHRAGVLFTTNSIILFSIVAAYRTSASKRASLRRVNIEYSNVKRS